MPTVDMEGHVCGSGDDVLPHGDLWLYTASLFDQGSGQTSPPPSLST